jgi:hypothetical protein
MKILEERKRVINMNNLESLQKLMEETMKELKGYLELIESLKNENDKNKQEYDYNAKVLNDKIDSLNLENKELKSYIQNSDGLVKLYDKNEKLKEENKILNENLDSNRKKTDAYLLEIYDKDKMLSDKEQEIDNLNNTIKEHVNKEVE